MWMQQYCGHSEKAIVTFPTVHVCRARWRGIIPGSVTQAKPYRQCSEIVELIIIIIRVFNFVSD